MSRIRVQFLVSSQGHNDLVILTFKLINLSNLCASITQSINQSCS